VLGRVWIAENHGPGLDRNVDVLGSVTITAAMVLGAYAIVTAGSHGWGSAHTLGLGAAAVALIAVFWALESRLANPIMPPRVFRIRGLAASSAVRGLFICGMYAVFFIGTLYMEHIRGFDALTTGVAFLPQTIALALLSMGPVAWLVGRFGPRPPLLAGLVFGVVGVWLLSRLHPYTAYVPGLLVPFLCIGAGLAFMPLLTIAMANVPRGDAGLASGIVNTSLQMASAIGIAVLGTVSDDRTRTLTARGLDQTEALLGGYRLAFEVGAGCAAAALLVALVALRVPRRQPEQQLDATRQPSRAAG
jgi:Major Facilitator Superfamily